MITANLETDSLIGHRIIGPDGRFGRVDQSTEDVDAGLFVAKRGWWLFARRYVVSSELIRSIDWHEGVVYVNAGQTQMRELPYEPAEPQTDPYGSRLAPLEEPERPNPPVGHTWPPA